jgi:glycosyltransferase involved in cell wall biosynthesis
VRRLLAEQSQSCARSGLRCSCENRSSITHHGSYGRRPSGLDLVLRLKHAVVERTTSVAISQHVAACFETNSLMIPDPYDARKFAHYSPATERSADLIFLGRLVSEKGIDLLLETLALLRARNLSPP